MFKKSVFYRSVIAILTLVLIGYTGYGASRSDVSGWYVEGVAALTLGDVEHARKCFLTVIRADPGHAPSYYQLSELARVGEDYGKALDYSEKAYRLDPGFFTYADNYARNLAVVGYLERADSLVSELVAQGNVDAETLSLHAMIKFSNHDYFSTLSILDTVETRWGIQVPLIDFKRQSLLQTRKYFEAYEYMLHVTEVIPDQPAFRIQLAELAASIHRDSMALAQYHAAIEIDSSGVLPRFALAEYYRLKGFTSDYLKALVPIFANTDFPVSQKIELFDLYLKDPQLIKNEYPLVYQLIALVYDTHPTDNDARSFFISNLFYLGKLDTAQETLHEWITREDVSVEFHQRMIELTHFKKQKDSMDMYIRMAKERFPRNPDLNITLMQVSFMENDTEGAERYARELLRYADSDSVSAVAYGFLGDMDYQRGNSKSAFKNYKKALKKDPDNAMILNNYAYYLSLEKRNLPLALEMSVRSNQMDELNPTYLDTQAWILYQMGRYEQAQEVMQKALVMDKSGSSEILMHYGDILFALGKNFTAETYWKKALEAGADAREIEARLKQLTAE